MQGEKLMKRPFHEGNNGMSDLQYAGRTTSIVIGFCIYILIWRYALNKCDTNYDYYGLSWEKVIKLLCCIWVYGHMILLVCSLIAWFVWSWM